ncbi:MAG: hypothetical protein Q6370_009010, partial [Candidatus Sigynarchaeota archaeon]
AGVYEVVAGFPCPCRVVVCDELELSDDNIPLLVLGSIETVKKAIVQLARAGPELRRAMGRIKSWIYYMYHDEVKDMTEMKEFTPADIRRNIAHAIEEAGIEETITELGIAKVVDALGVEKVKDAIARMEAEKASAKKNTKKR